ncbi:hypothetical protein V2J09_018368 [Rumex salicifolius]
MTDTTIQNHLLEVGVVECVKLKDTKWFTKQDPYVCLQYGSTKFKTRTCSGGGTAPVFQEKFNFMLIEGLREITVEVWNHHRLSRDNLIGSGKMLYLGVMMIDAGLFSRNLEATPQRMPPPAAIPPPPYTNAAAYPPPPLPAYPPYLPPPSPLLTTTTYHPYGDPAPGQYNRMYPASPY